jgi:hypothetical protein
MAPTFSPRVQRASPAARGVSPWTFASWRAASATSLTCATFSVTVSRIKSLVSPITSFSASVVGMDDAIPAPIARPKAPRSRGWRSKRSDRFVPHLVPVFCSEVAAPAQGRRGGFARGSFGIGSCDGPTVGCPARLVAVAVETR